MPSKNANSRENPLNATLRRCRVGLLLVMVFSLAINLLMLAAPLYMLQVFDRVLTSRSTDTLLYLTGVTCFAFLIFLGLDLVRGRIMVSLGTWIDRHTSGAVLKASVMAGLSRRSISIQPLRDLSTIRMFLTGPAIFPIFDAPWTPIFIAVIFLLHPILGWFALAGASVLFVFALTNDFSTRGALQKAGQASTLAQDQAQAAVRNADAIEAMGMMPNVASGWTKIADEALAQQASASRISGLITSSSKTVRQLLQVGILGIGAWLVLGNELTAGGMIAGSILMARALAPVEQAIASWRTAITTRSAYHRLKALLAMSAQPIIVPPLPAPQGHLSVETVTFAHPGEREPVLRGVSFKLKPGESLGLIGPTASGKTTLARILVGNLKPQRGSARLGGADLAEWDARDRGQYVGYVPQDIELFGGTVRENIARMGDGNPEAVYTAANLAGAHEEILALPNGYDTEIGVSGMALSGGQRQRIALARALYGNPRLVLLDEPNANLDVSGEAALVGALNELKKRGVTVVIIAHRPHVLRLVDKILVLRDGAVHMMGPRDEIFAQPPTEQGPRPATLTRETGALQS